MIVTTSLIATKLTHQRRPERAHLLERKKIQAPLAHGGVHHDELAPRIDVDPLPVRAPEHEHPALAREDPRLVAVPSLGVAVPGHTCGWSMWTVVASRTHAAGMICRPRQLPSWASSSPRRA